jgi:hypothetical protein
MHTHRVVTSLDLPSRFTQPSQPKSSPLRMRRSLRRLFATLRRDLSRSYRPERHYMRGPGPAWRARYGSGANPFTSAP